MNKDAREIFVDNFKRIMFEKSKKPAQIARDLKLPLSTVAGWANGSSYPRVDSMQRLADYLNVSMRTLTDVKSDSSNQITKIIQDLELASWMRTLLTSEDEDLYKLLKIVSQLDEDKIKTLLVMAEALDK